MDFALLPPEVNSARMYAGPGPGPMLAAAAGWAGLAVDVESSATAYQQVVSGLTGDSWLGPSAVSMAAVAMRYVSWLRATAELAAQAAAQARQAVSAYEEAFAMVVAPPVIAANRNLLMSLIASNLLGQNTSAIAATEAEYSGMWAQDVAAMYAYAAQSAIASALPAFSPAPHTTDTGGAPSQSAAVGQTAATSAGTGAITVTSGLSVILEALGFTSAQSFLSLFGFVSPYTATMATVNLCVGLSRIEDEESESEAGSTFASEVDSAPGVATPASPASPGRSTVTAALGERSGVGRLSTPPAWALAAPEFRTVARPSPVAAGGAPAAAAGISGAGASWPRRLFIVPGRAVASISARKALWLSKASSLIARPPRARV